MRKYLFILLILFTLPFREGTGLGLSATTVEQRQQFTYYWYAARQAIEEERYADALVLLTFCEQLNPQDGTTLDYLGTMYDALNEQETALQLYRRANQADPRDQWWHLTRMLLQRDSEADKAEALRVMERALTLNPKNEDLLEQLKQTYVERQMWKEALHTQDQLDGIRGYDAWSAITRYRIYVIWNKPKQALAAIDKYLELDPGDLRFLVFRLELMERFNAKPAERFEMYEKILSYDPGNLMILNNYAYLLATTGGDLRKAEQMSQQTIREEGDNPVYLDTYGWILHLQKQDQLALFYLQKALMNSTPETRGEIEKHLKVVRGER